MDMIITKDKIDESCDWDQASLIAEAVPEAKVDDLLFALHKQLRPAAEQRGYTLRVDKLRHRLYSRSMTSKYRAVTREQLEPALLKVAAAEAVRRETVF